MSLEGQIQKVLELLRGFKIDEDTIELYVMSNGCTRKEDFEVQVNKGFTGVSPVELTVVRVRPDTCKMLPGMVTITFTKKELEIEGCFEATLTNKFGSGLLLDKVVP
ncbi:hypothetical protein [Pseudomonas mosselii]|uniref:hypothetical protein n=1 Tax=Pseudomonas mosselii TaxID=78327 RepID=UPI000D8A3BD2|nr:hypothetical protein [Pseudomonas mosselii]PYC20634.1 hypothetical protein DMX06_13280 [Pseudomonas mosselii]